MPIGETSTWEKEKEEKEEKEQCTPSTGWKTGGRVVVTHV
jgi:hypothetical protein